ncbi:MAG TPA: sugar phosphate isomerase/epimerase [Bacilli bacterium]
MSAMQVGLQLYTLRDEMAADAEGTLRKVAALGYAGVEFAGYHGMSASDIRSLLDELGMVAIGSHVGLDSIRGNLQGEIDFLKTIGGSYLVCPYISVQEMKNERDWTELFSLFQETGEITRKQGLQFGYHNHDFEFLAHVRDQFVFDALYSSTTSDAVQVEMDVCWVQFAGQDPIAYIKKYANRLPLLHLKDFSKDQEGKLKTLELGQGVVQLADVIGASSESGVRWLIVEQDNCQNPPLQSVENSMSWLVKHGFQAYTLKERSN